MKLEECTPKRFYFLRHAQTDAHIERLICGGDWDLPLNSEGVLQATAAAKQFAGCLSDVGEILCSPLLRARQTAEFFSEELSRPVRTVENLREWRLGDWDRKPWDEVPDLFTGSEDPPGGESRAEFGGRVRRLLTDIKLLSDVLVVGHGAVAFSLLKALGLTPTHVPSCHPFKLEYLDGRFEMTALSGQN